MTSYSSTASLFRKLPYHIEQIHKFPHHSQRNHQPKTTTNPRSPKGTFPKQPLSKLLTLHWTPGKPVENRWKLTSETNDPNHPQKQYSIKTQHQKQVNE